MLAVLSEQTIGQTLDSYVRDVAYLLVMGAYGQFKLSKFIPGGATAHVLSNPKYRCSSRIKQCAPMFKDSHQRAASIICLEST